MRIWDIDPGYLNRQSLLGEHRELHGIVSIIVNRKKGYSRHPETIRWRRYGWALRQRHRQLAVEMALRGYTDRSPVTSRSNRGKWPDAFIDPPHRQFELLREKYADRGEGRIPLPTNVQQVWSHHKYSVLARDQQLYRELGREVAAMNTDFAALADLLTGLLRIPPSAGGMRNALQHMWGHVSDHPPAGRGYVVSRSPHRLLRETQQRAMAVGEPYLTASTALGELMAWLEHSGEM